MLVDQTQPARKRKESKALASCIKHTSFEMFLCSEYEKHNFKYVVLDKENSDRCSEYVFYKVKCDVKSIPIRKWRPFKIKEDWLEQECKAVLRFAKASLT
jgi:hypothetical protein